MGYPCSSRSFAFTIVYLCTGALPIHESNLNFALRRQGSQVQILSDAPLLSVGYQAVHWLKHFRKCVVSKRAKANNCPRRDNSDHFRAKSLHYACLVSFANTSISEKSLYGLSSTPSMENPDSKKLSVVTVSVRGTCEYILRTS